MILSTVTLLTSCGSEKSRAERLLKNKQVALTSASLHQALKTGQDEVALSLLLAGVPPQLDSASSKTPLMLAAKHSCHRSAWQLLPDRAVKLPQDNEGLSALVHAARSGQGWLVRELLRRGASPNTYLPTGGTLVAECIEEGRTSIARLLLEAGANVDSGNARREPILAIASRLGYPWLVDELLKSGASPSLQGADVQPLVHLVTQSDTAHLVETLEYRGANLHALNTQGENAVHTAVSHGASSMIAPLHKRGVSVEAADHKNNRPLHLAIMNQHLQSVHELLRLGANPNQTGRQGLSPLALALDIRDWELASLLIRYGASPANRLHKALSNDDRELIDFLLSNGADPNCLCSLKNDTLLGAAVRNNNRWAAFRLLKAGALPNALTREGQTAFHLAVAKMDLPLIKMMLQHDADPNLPFYSKPKEEFLDLVASPNIARWSLARTRRFTPIHLAADSGNLELARLLIHHGADTRVYTLGGGQSYWYPESWASRRMDVPMMQLMLGKDPDTISRWAKIDLSKQRAWVYDGDSEIYTTRVSTGKPGHRTRTGNFVITQRKRNHNSTIYGSSMPYFQRFSCGDFGFHYGYVPGYPASHGCIRVPWSGAKKLWQLLSLGTEVKIVP
ncbi:MAG: ankyrin repeat domain-containing protein [Verrucomicrobiota bacterium]